MTRRSFVAKHRSLHRIITYKMAQLALQLLVIAEMRAHEALPKLPVVRGMKVKQLVNYDIILEFPP